MARFYIKPQSIGKIKKNFAIKSEKLQQRIIKAMVIWADDVAGDIKLEYIRVRAFSSGELAGSVTRTAPFRIQSRVRIVIFTNKEYASIIEFGRRAGGKPPPLKALVGWAKRAGIITHLPVNIPSGGRWPGKWAASKVIFENIKKGGGKGGAKKKALDPEIRELLMIRFLAASIQKKGIKGRKPMTTIFNARAKTFKRDIVALANSLP